MIDRRVSQKPPNNFFFKSQENKLLVLCRVQTDVQRGAGAKIPLSQFRQAMGFAQELFVFVFGAAQRCAPLDVAVRRSVVGSSARTGASRRSPFGRWIVWDNFEARNVRLQSLFFK